MNAKLAHALNRTMLLMRDDLREETPESALLKALTSTEVLLTADRANLSSHSAQTAYVTAALLMARSGHHVYLMGPDVPLLGAQPPLPAGGIISSLLAVGPWLLPGVALSAGSPRHPVDISFRLGDTRSAGDARRSIAICATRWGGHASNACNRWPNLAWPLGGLAAAALGAGEAFKAAMWKLERFAVNPNTFRGLHAHCNSVRVALAPEDTLEISQFGAFDVISAGAIANGLLYCFARILDTTGAGRIFDFDRGDLSNMNRNMLMVEPDSVELKVDVLAKVFREGLTLQGLPFGYDEQTAARIGTLGRRVLVGVDHIPTRWLVQARRPRWLGIGATSHWSAMASFHTERLACARCLHPTDDPIDAPIPTVAFVSFWAGLLLATYFLQSLRDDMDLPSAQQTYLTPLRPELPWRTPIVRRADCPLCSRRSSPLKME